VAAGVWEDRRARVQHTALDVIEKKKYCTRKRGRKKKEKQSNKFIRGRMDGWMEYLTSNLSALADFQLNLFSFKNK
jgi:hypothetical protein